MTFTDEQAVSLNAQLGRITSWQRLLHAGINALEQLPPDAQARKADGVLTILTTMEAPAESERLPEKTADNPVWVSLPDTTKEQVIRSILGG